MCVHVCMCTEGMYKFRMTAATKDSCKRKRERRMPTTTKSQGQKVRDETAEKERKLTDEKKKILYGSYNNLISFKGLVSPPPLYNEIPTC